MKSYKIVTFSGYPSRLSNWSFFIYRSFGYNVNNIWGISKLGGAAVVISGAYLANRINDRLIGTVSLVYSTYRPLFDHQYSGSYRQSVNDARFWL